MIIEEGYEYRFIDSYDFNKEYLMCNESGSKYRKFIIVSYEENNTIKTKELIDEEEINNYKNIIAKYNVEEIISSNSLSNYGYYKKIIYFNIEGVGTFIKYTLDNEFINEEAENNKNHDFRVLQNNNDEIKELLIKHNIYL